MVADGVAVVEVDDGVDRRFFRVSFMAPPGVETRPDLGSAREGRPVERERRLCALAWVGIAWCRDV